MQKKVLSEIVIYSGEVKMPEGFEISRKKLCADILDSPAQWANVNSQKNIYYKNKDCKIPFSRSLDILNTYLRENFNLKYKIKISEHSSFGNVYQPQEQSFLRHQVNPLDLKNSPDLTMIYGVNIAQNSCDLAIEYKDNKRSELSCHIPLENNNFIVFPSIQKYMITTNQSNQINCILTTTFYIIG